ncbi:hypothetical protein [Paraburkholderia sp.]
MNIEQIKASLVGDWVSIDKEENRPTNLQIPLVRKQAIGKSL